MINHLEDVLRRLFLSQVAGLGPPATQTDQQVGFQPPDADWRAHVNNLQLNALNVYLVDLRENRKLRSSDRTRDVVNGIATETPVPRWVDCHFLVSAWSPGQPGPIVEPTRDENAMLYEVTGVLMNTESLVPRDVFAPSMLPAGFPALLADLELPTTVLPVEGFPKYAEFWGTMSANHPWRPAVYLVITLPVVLQPEISGPIVTTRITEYRQNGKPETAEVWIQIGGQVLDGTVNPAVPVVDAWVRLETSVGAPLQTTQTGKLGRFTFSGMQTGQYQLRIRAVGLGEKVRTVDVPSNTGEYDLRFP
jgi:hypothetical protein